MFNNWKLLCAGRSNEVDPKFAYPLLRWMSGKESNLEACADINFLFFKIEPSMVITLLGTRCKGGFFKYPKKTKAENSAYDELLREKIMQYYGWSSIEFEKNKGMLQFIDVNELNKKIGFNEKECRTLGVAYEKTKHKFVAEKPKPKGLSGFM